MKRQRISGIYADPAAFDGQSVTVCGWARTIRDIKNFGFIDLNDGSCFKSLQVVFERDALDNYDEIAKQKEQLVAQLNALMGAEQTLLELLKGDKNDADN